MLDNDGWSTGYPPRRFGVHIERADILEHHSHRGEDDPYTPRNQPISGAQRMPARRGPAGRVPDDVDPPGVISSR